MARRLLNAPQPFDGGGGCSPITDMIIRSVEKPPRHVTCWDSLTRTTPQKGKGWNESMKAVYHNAGS